MNEAGEILKDKTKKVLKPLFKMLIPIILITVIIVIFLSSAYYAINDKLCKVGDDYSSTNYGANQFINNTSIDKDGKMTSNLTAQETWDKLVENDSEVEKYLDSPEELVRLMNAEIVTQYPDLRKNPDEEIDWDKLDWKKIANNESSMQGIIKFKRVDENNNKTTMSYVDPDTFQGYIDEYNKSGSETAKKNALTHFTLKKTSTETSSGSSQSINYTGPDLCWPLDNKYTTITSQFGYRDAPTEGATTNHDAIDISGPDIYGANIYACESGTVETSASTSGRGNYVVINHGNGYKSRYQHATTLLVSEGEKVKKGQVIATVGNTGVGTGAHLDFHIDFNGQAINPLDFKYNNGMGNGSGGFGSSTSDEEDEKDNEDKTQTAQKNAQEVSVTGDGYSKEYTSSAGITYKQYKQIEGSYARDAYWDADIYNSGCGPSSVAILASGLLEKDYTPGDIAKEMNEKYGMTSYDTLKQEMDSLGMKSEVIQSPSAKTIQDNLKSGKVMLVSVNSNTIFTGSSHIMALIDINTKGQVYVANPASNTLCGWYDISEIMAGCKYIVTTDAGASGVATATNNSSSYTAYVAQWKEVRETIESNDPNAPKEEPPQYYMDEIPVNYQEKVSKYTMPFDLLWAFLVIGEDKNFVFDLADLVYGSDIEISIYDNLEVDTKVQDWNYTLQTEAKINLSLMAEYYDSVKGVYYYAQDSDSMKNHVDDPYDEKPYNTVKTVVTKTDKISDVLTRANVWMVDYKNDYTYASENKPGDESPAIKVEDTEYPSKPSRTGDTFSCEHINTAKANVTNDVVNKFMNAYKSNNSGLSSTISVPTDDPLMESVVRSRVKVSENFKSVEYYERYVKISKKITNNITTKKYIEGVPNINEKIDPDAKEPNFITIYRKKENRKNRKYIDSVASWLFEALETNDDIGEKLTELIKYLLYKATGTDYGVKEYDFSEFDATKFNIITTGAEGALSLKTTMFTKEVFKKALQEYYNETKNTALYNNFLSKIDELYDASEQNGINPELVIITAQAEGGFSEAGGSYNYWGVNVPNGASHGDDYTSLADGIAGYASYIKKYETGSFAATIMQRYEERKAAGCDPTGYGLPGTLSGMQSLYSFLGKHEYGSAGTGGYYYMDPARANVTKIYKTHEEFLSKCKDSGLPEHAEGTTTTVYEQGQYTAWQVEKKLSTWQKIFGKYGSLDSNKDKEDNVDK